MARTEQAIIAMTAEEKSQLKWLADKLNLSMSATVRRCIQDAIVCHGAVQGIFDSLKTLPEQLDELDRKQEEKAQ